MAALSFIFKCANSPKLSGAAGSRARATEAVVPFVPIVQVKAPVFPAVVLIPEARAAQQSEPVVLNPSPCSVKVAGSVAASPPKARVSLEVPPKHRMTIELATATFICA